MKDGYNNELMGDSKNFNEKFTKSADNISRIVITSSFIKVNVSTSNSQKVEINLHGNAVLSSGSIDLKVHTNSEELLINVVQVGSIAKNNLTLDIAIPYTKTFDELSVKSVSDIIIGEDISVKELKVYSEFGNFTSYATFVNAVINTPNNNSYIFVNAKQNISLDISTQFGNISLKFANIANVNCSNLGDFRHKSFVVNYKKIPGGYVADLSYQLGCGNMEISDY